jgi:hypothetical protein
MRNRFCDRHGRLYTAPRGSNKYSDRLRFRDLKTDALMTAAVPPGAAALLGSAATSIVIDQSIKRRYDRHEHSIMIATQHSLV